ncbi:MAG: alkaline phosphatase family protein [Thermodesulfobacteriota bacterium]|nr:alkaline phosphatase family protein [Thermodesulfobacteriota bacterium]
MKTILVLLDGLGDRSYKILGDRTPLQAARTPNLDRLARLGSNGLFHAALPGQCLPSEIAHYLLLGYDLEDFPGRGLLEAVGYDVEFDDRDVLCLAHIASVSWKTGVPILARKRPPMDDEELRQVFSAIATYEVDGIAFRLQQTRSNDAILILSGQASPCISDSDPMVVSQAMAKIWALSDNPEPESAAQSAKALNAYLTHCYRVLSEHEVNRRRQANGMPPANFLATQRCGRRIEQEPFDQKWGMAGMFIASGAMYKGLAHELGLRFTRVKDTDKPDEDLRERIDLALADHARDFIHVHTKVPDEAGHTGDPRRKEAAIAALDRGLEELIRAVGTRDDLLVVVTADHSTPSMGPLIHSGEPVPVMLVGPTVRRDGVEAFDEVSAAKGSLGLLKGRELMLTILNYSNRASLLSHHLGPHQRPYVPRTYEPFGLKD